MRSGRSRSASGSCSSPDWRRSVPASSTPVPSASTPSDVTLARLFVACAAPSSPSACSPWSAADDSPPRSPWPSTPSPSVRGRRPACSTSRGSTASSTPRRRQFTDTVCAALGAIAVAAALAALIRRRTAVTAGSPRPAGVGDRIVRRRGDAARCHPRSQPRRGRRAHPRRRRVAGARRHRRAQPRHDRRRHRRRPGRSRRRIELAAGVRPDAADRRVGRRRRRHGPRSSAPPR